MLTDELRIARILASIYGHGEETVAGLDLGGYFEDATRLLKSLPNADATYKKALKEVGEWLLSKQVHKGHLKLSEFIISDTETQSLLNGEMPKEN